MDPLSGIVGRVSLALALASIASAQNVIVPEYSTLANTVTDRQTVHADASYDEIFEDTRAIHTESEVQNRSVIALHFISSLSSAEVQDAYVMKANGTKILVGKDHIVIRDAPETNGYADFGDNKVLQVLYPNVAVGDKLYVKAHFHSQAIFPGHFSDIEVVDPLGYPMRYTGIVDAPKSLKIIGKARGDIQLKQEIKGDRDIFTYTYGHDVYHQGEPAMEDPADFAGSFSISNFKNWSEVAQAYKARAEDKAEVTPALQQLATQLIGEKKGLDAVKAIDTWVRSNVRYVQVYLEAGGYVPHTADSILRNKYGDCKDYVTLTQALLKAVGIESEPVLTSTLPRYQELPVPNPEQFNHVILYVPSLKFYLDPTDRFAPTGFYSIMLLNKPILDITTGELKRFSVKPAQKNSYNEIVNMSLENDGTIIGSTSISLSGGFLPIYRSIISNVPAGQTKQVAQRVLTNRNEAGTGDYSLPENFSDFREPEVTGQWKSPQLISMNDVVTFKIPQGLTMFSIEETFKNYALENRITPIINDIISYHKLITIKMPDNYKITYLPKNIHVDNRNLAYNITYKQLGQNLVFEISLSTKANIVSPKDYPVMRQELLDLEKALKTDIVLTKK